MRRIVLLFILVALTAALAACGGSGGSPSEGSGSGAAATEPPATPKTVEIEMHADLANNLYYFDPIGVKINPGDTVRWVNKSENMPHNAQSVDGKIPAGAEPFTGPMLTTVGETYEHTFTTPGTHVYFCLPHQALGMYGVIVVGEPGGPGNDYPEGVDLPTPQDVAAQGAVSFKDFSSQ